MSLTFKFQGDKNTEATPEETVNPSVELYQDAGHLRHIIFQDKEGLVRTYYYAWLSSIKLNAAKTELTLEFGEEHVILKGENLGGLHEDLSVQYVRRIEPTDKRYASLMNKSNYQVTEVNFN